MPVGLERWVRAAVGRPVPFPVVPVVAVGGLVLAIVPLLWAGAVRQVYPATSTEMVERLVPTTVTYVGISGLAMTVPFPAPGRIGTPPYGLLVRDTLASSDLTVVTTGADPRLPSRTVIGRMIGRPFGDAAAALFTGRGEDIRGLDPSRMLVEVAPETDEEVIAVSSVADLAAVAAGSLVRIALEFDGESIPTCALEGTCHRGVLAAGTAVFVHLAHGGDGGESILVQLGYPSSVVPGEWAGEQVHWSEPFDIGELTIFEYDPERPQISNGQALEDFAESPGVQSLAGWGRILVQASIAHDPNLIRDRLWLGPLLLTLLAALLWLGGRYGYPYFRPLLEGSRRWTTRPEPDTPTPGAPTADLAIRVSGHALTVGGQRRNLDEDPAILRPASGAGEGRVTAAIDLADGTQIPLAAHDTGLLGRLERGEVVSLGGVRPALWAHWYGTDLRMTFESAAARDLAADLVSRGGAQLRSGA